MLAHEGVGINGGLGVWGLGCGVWDGEGCRAWGVGRGRGGVEGIDVFGGEAPLWGQVGWGAGLGALGSMVQRMAPLVKTVAKL